MAERQGRETHFLTWVFLNVKHGLIMECWNLFLPVRQLETGPQEILRVMRLMFKHNNKYGM